MEGLFKEENKQWFIHALFDFMPIRCLLRAYACQPWSACVWNSCGSSAVTSTISTWASSSAALRLLLPPHAHPSPHRSAIFTCIFITRLSHEWSENVDMRSFYEADNLGLIFWVSLFSINFPVRVPAHAVSRSSRGFWGCLNFLMNLSSSTTSPVCC